MNKRPGQIKVTTETGFCSFCDRTRNLRREERQLGALIRTVIACDSCHRILSSTIGVAGPEAPAEAPVEAGTAPVEVETKPAPVKPASSPKPRAADAKPKAAGAKSTAPTDRNKRTG